MELLDVSASQLCPEVSRGSCRCQYACSQVVLSAACTCRLHVICCIHEDPGRASRSLQRSMARGGGASLWILENFFLSRGSCDHHLAVLPRRFFRALTFSCMAT